MEDLFRQLLLTHRSVDIANSEFQRQLADDPELRERYRDWCDAAGSIEKNGFLDFAEEYIKEQDSIFDTLTDYAD